MGIFFFATASRSEQGPAHPPMYRWLLPRVQTGRDVKLTTYFLLVPRLRMRGNVHPLPQYIFMAWCLIKQ